MQSVVESEQEEIDMQKNLDERQLNKSRLWLHHHSKGEKNIYIYIHYIYIQKKRRRKIDLEASPSGKTQQKTTSSKVLPVELKVLPVGLDKKWAVAKSYR